MTVKLTMNYHKSCDTGHPPDTRYCQLSIAGHVKILTFKGAIL